jgi:hypothetical protein
MMLGRTIRLAGGEDISLIPARWYTRIFVTADVTTLVIQGLGKSSLQERERQRANDFFCVGASIMGTMQLALALAGEKIVIAGLALQVATFVVFLGASADFQMRMGKKKTASSSSLPTEAANWRKMLYILYSVSALILSRCTFRLIEYAMGNAGYLIAHEWTLYCFDAVPMFLVLVLLLVLQPSKYVPQALKKVSDEEPGVLETGAVKDK